MDPFSVAGLALAVVGTLDLCLKYGKQVISICQKLRNIENDIDDMVLTIQGLWLKTEVQLEFLKVLWDTLPPPLQDHYVAALGRLQSKTLAAWKSLEHVTDPSGTASNTQGTDGTRLAVHKLKAIYLRKHIKQAISDLEDWQGKFDPSWYLITRIASPVVDRQLKDDTSRSDSSTRRLAQMREAIKSLSTPNEQSKGSIFRDQTLIESELCQIPRSNTFISSYRHSTQAILLDRTNYSPETPITRVKTYVRNLARLLLNVDPMTFGLLKCEGVVELRDDNGAISLTHSWNSSVSSIHCPVPSWRRFRMSLC